MSTECRELIKKYEIEVLNHFGKSVQYSWLGKGILSDVRDQGCCCASWAFVIADSIQSQFAIMMKNLGYLPRLRHLAPQELIDCCKKEFPTEKLPDKDKFEFHSSSFINGFKYVQKYGICEEKAYPYTDPYTEKKGCCRACSIEGPKYFIENYEEVDKGNTVAAIDQMPLPCAIAFTFEMLNELINYKDGIFQSLTLEETQRLEKEGKQGVGYHALLIVGYGTEDDGREYFIVKNTLGKKWGKHGYGKISPSGAFYLTRPTKTIYK